MENLDLMFIANLKLTLANLGFWSPSSFLELTLGVYFTIKKYFASNMWQRQEHRQICEMEVFPKKCYQVFIQGLHSFHRKNISTIFLNLPVSNLCGSPCMYLIKQCLQRPFPYLSQEVSDYLVAVFCPVVFLSKLTLWFFRPAFHDQSLRLAHPL